MKTKAIYLAFLGVLLPLHGFSAEVEEANSDEIQASLEGVEIISARVPLTNAQSPRLVTVLTAQEISASPIHSINDLLEYAAGVDVRQRGEFGVQTDISVRGGTFDQITVLLNGVNISSPHTGHLTADFPVSVQDIERIEVLEGPSARVFGTSAFTGVINIVTKKDKDLSAHVYGGDFGLKGIEASNHFLGISGKNGSFDSRISGGYSGSDGATPNSDFTSGRVFVDGDYQGVNASINYQFGYSYKQYGANTFYGAASTDQWESNEKLIGSVSGQYTVGALHIAPSIAWNRWFDHYQWHKNSPAGENYHMVDTWSSALNSWVETDLGKTSFGFEMRSEGIYSTKLGKPMETTEYFNVRGHDAVDTVQYRNSANRTNVSAFLEHDVILDRWTISLGLLANMNTALDSKWRLYPGIDVSYRPAQSWKLFLSYNKALRMPTFTDLYYSGTNIVGTSDLKPERTSDASVGARFRRQGWQAESQIFYSHKTDMIDWVIYQSEPDGKTFRSGNFSLDGYGVEFSGSFMPQEIYVNNPIRRIGIQYSYIDQDIEYSQPIISSKYAMEYLRHKLVVQADANIWKGLDASVSWRYQDRVGQGNEPYDLLDCRISYSFEKHRLMMPKTSIYVDCSNILDKKYFDYSFIPQPGRWIKAGVTFHY